MKKFLGVLTLLFIVVSINGCGYKADPIYVDDEKKVVEK